MTSNKKLFFVAATALAAFAFAPAASANSVIEDGATDISGLTEATNAAAAVRVEYDDEGSVTSLSASSAFGESNAAAIATETAAVSIGSSESSGNISAPVFDVAPGTVSVNFGADLHDDGSMDDGSMDDGSMDDGSTFDDVLFPWL